MDNNCCYMERMFQHRRNKALESLQVSCNLPSLHFSRMSAGMEYSGPLTMRLSDLSAYDSPRKHDSKPTRTHHIRNNLQELEEKLNKARTLLEISQKKEESKQMGGMGGLGGMQQLKLFTCSEEDESTLNLDSQAFFKMVATTAKRAKDYYVGALINSLTGANPSIKKHLKDSMHILRSGLSLPLPSVFELQHRKVQIQRSSKNYSKKTLLLELEDTLLSWNPQRQNEHDFQVSYNKQKGYISLRPYALSFMKKIAQNFELIVFTRFQQRLAKAIAEVIDEQGRYIEHMLTKEHCLVLGGEYLCKDLRMLNRSPRDTLILDCNPVGYMVNCENGVPILPFYKGEERELVELQRFLLREVAGSGDVREVCRRWFRLASYWQFGNEADLIQELYL